MIDSQTQVRIAEWTRLGPAESAALRGRALTPEGREQAATLDLMGAARIRELRTGLEIETRSFVGSAAIDGLRIDLVPKMGLPYLMRMVARSYGLGDLTLLDPELGQGLGTSGFADLLGHALAVETRRLARRGLLQDYVMCEEELSTPRGRVNLRQWASGPPSTTVLCRFETFTADHDLHRVLKSGLMLASSLVHDRHLQFDLTRTAERFFPDVTRRRITRAGLERVFGGLTRRTGSYRSALNLIGILLEGKSVETEKVEERARVPAFLLDMNRLFERFLERELSRSKHGLFRVARQTQDHGAFRWADNPRRRRAPEIRPDLIFSRGTRTLAVADAKYKDYDVRSLATADLYQVTAYALACGDREAAPVFILYPTTRRELVEGGDLRFAGLGGRASARISILGVPVTRMLEDEQYDLAAVLAEKMGIGA